MNCITHLKHFWLKFWCIETGTIEIAHVPLHNLSCCTELEFTDQQLSFIMLRVFNVQLQGYNSGQFYLDLL